MNSLEKNPKPPVTQPKIRIENPSIEWARIDFPVQREGEMSTHISGCLYVPDSLRGMMSHEGARNDGYIANDRRSSRRGRELES